MQMTPKFIGEELKTTIYSNSNNTKSEIIIANCELRIANCCCWGFEIIAANTNPTTSSSYHWQARKNICMGLMLVGVSGFLAGFLGATLVSEIAGEINE
ncbi:hypothetical protein NOS3756_55760 (plasmid) [Nostoc sp. NIES-3756]|uniref:hypothetical protein n=1 Tax=Nostoc sp. NIES-3756 TaxID=1751286 RepID=UPI000722EB0D|nr:hypothetical protein [Nostoc sp. NIES-3756]BAT56564.1 hypothetical protein NOS3756_55760 [Nostoc sp. NIES-3756]